MKTTRDRTLQPTGRPRRRIVDHDRWESTDRRRMIRERLFRMMQNRLIKQTLDPYWATRFIRH